MRENLQQKDTYIFNYNGVYREKVQTGTCTPLSVGVCVCVFVRLCVCVCTFVFIYETCIYMSVFMYACMYKLALCMYVRSVFVYMYA